MRPLVIAAILGLGVVPTTAVQSFASVSVKTKTVTYSISGKNGEALLGAMDRRGPKHGLLTRAIAQTRYVVNWDIDWEERGGACRIAYAAARLSITYSYPAVTSRMSPALERRWRRFMAGVQRHEEMHGRIARQMVNAAEKSVSAIRHRNDRGCRRTQAELKKRVAGIYAKYEARQVQFDNIEHREGGNVERLVEALARGKER
jgi:predicted secreted Zn-dependent protease